MKYCYLFLLLAFTSTGLIAQDSLKTRPFRDHVTLDMNGGVLFYPFDPFIIPFNLHLSPGVRISQHLAITGSYSLFGAESSYFTRRFSGYGIGLRYDRYPFMLKAEIIQLTRYEGRSEWESWYLRDRKTLNPMARLHIGFRVAPRFTAGLAIAHFRNLKVTGENYSSDLGDWTTFRRNLKDSSVQLFFGVSMGRRTKSSK